MDTDDCPTHLFDDPGSISIVLEKVNFCPICWNLGRIKIEPSQVQKVPLSSLSHFHLYLHHQDSNYDDSSGSDIPMHVLTTSCATFDISIMFIFLKLFLKSLSPKNTPTKALFSLFPCILSPFHSFKLINTSI